LQTLLRDGETLLCNFQATQFFHVYKPTHPPTIQADLSSNHFEGGLTSAFTRSKSLVYLNVSHNALSDPLVGPGADGWDTPDLRTLDLSHNNLWGGWSLGVAWFGGCLFGR